MPIGSLNEVGHSHIDGAIRGRGPILVLARPTSYSSDVIRVRSVLLGLLVSAVIAACGGGVATVGGDGGAGSDGSTNGGTDSGSITPNDGGAPLTDAARTKDAARDANPASCPATYTAPAGNCTIGTICSYDQGRCECDGYCGGAPPPPDTDFSHWTCTPKLDNGCPDDPPLQGSTCKIPTATCTYGPCCVETFTCSQSGKWSSGGIACPP
jgi:hypothetical protein